ncbi:MAG TPA: hypothetical protein VK149_02375 [Sideroxyarcus sp.]|nr:hypothetical protein [Sideroxyarcus sp.]
MHRTYIRIPANFFRVSLHTESDSMTLALVPDQVNANLIAQLLNAHYGIRKGETITVTPTVIRHADDETADAAKASQH